MLLELFPELQPLKLAGVADKVTLAGLFVDDTRLRGLAVPGVQTKDTGPIEPLDRALAENVIVTLVGDQVILGGAELAEGP